MALRFSPKKDSIHILCIKAPVHHQLWLRTAKNPLIKGAHMSKARAPKHPPPSPSEPSVEAPAEGFTTDPHGRTIAHVPKPSPPSNHLACHLLPMLRARHKVIGGVLPMSTAALPKSPPYQLISSHGKSKQKQFACSRSIRPI